MHRVSIWIPTGTLVVLAVLVLSIPAAASDPGKEPMYRIHSVPSGYDPFVLNSHTGRFDYVPIPYEPQRPGSGYDPFRINWHSGQFDYVPIPLQSDYEFAASSRRDESSNPLIDFDARATAQATRGRPPTMAPQMTGAPLLAPGVEYNIVTLPVRPRGRSNPATKPTTAPSNPPPAGADNRLVHLSGRWQFDYATGRWTFVLPPG